MPRHIKANRRVKEVLEVVTATKSPSLKKAYEQALKDCPFISMTPGIMSGVPCIKHTRIPVASVLRSIRLYGAAQAAYPQLGSGQIDECLRFAELVFEPLSAAR